MKGGLTNSHNRGAALLIALAFVVLVTVAVLSFFMVTQNSLLVTKSAPVQVELNTQVQTATESIIGDLRMEMLAGATVDATREGYDTFEPLEVTRRWAMVPAPVRSASIPEVGFESLIKQSLAGRQFYPGGHPADTYAANGPAGAQGSMRASSVNTSTPSSNGRILSAARWDSVGLTETTFPDNALPDWVYITRLGVPVDGGGVAGANVSDPALSNADYVLGRFAYNIYDVGGLLNANAAGFVASDPTQAENASRKGGVAWADLEAIGLTEAQIGRLVDQFRNASTKDRFLEAMDYQAESSGFLKPLDGDGFFYSRQDLIRFVLGLFGRSKVSECTEAERRTLNALTQDTRFLTAPSWRPVLKPVLTIATGGNDHFGKDAATNPAVAKLEVLPGREFSRLRFRDAENYTDAYEVPAKAGEALLNSRFPLDRLKLLTRQAVASSSSSTIYRYFGLQRSSNSDPWVYNHGANGRILTLEEVQQQAREPDMVELLKASILVGSLGKSAGAKTAGGEDADFRDIQVDRQVMQIFANIIDQTTETGFPTRLEFGGQNFYGVKNLPYLMRVKTFMARLLPDSEPYSSGDPYSFGFLPEVWNPHDPSVPAPSDRPTNIRVVADTEGLIFSLRVDRKNDDISWSEVSKLSFAPMSNSLRLTESAINATEPILLKDASLASPASAPLGLLNIVGIFAPEFALTYEASESNYITQQFNFRYVIESPGIIFAMEYFDPLSNKWERYMQRQVDNSPTTGKTFAHRGKTSTNEFKSQNNTMFFGIDPRTDRFASYRLQERQIRDNNWREIVGAYRDSESLRPDTGTGHGSGTGHKQDPDRARGWVWANGSASLSSDSNGGYALATVLQNKAGYATYYADADGEVRPGDGFLASGTGAEGQMYLPGNVQSRPIVLNRPFRSVAELGYVFRDMPGRSLDFFSTVSGDAALLDFFSVHESPDDGITAGRISANTQNPKVVEALLRGALADETGQDISDNRATAISEEFVKYVKDNGPFLNKAEIVTRFLGNSTVGASSERIKRRREVVARALGDSMETRTWNLLIDLVVQSGRVPKSPDGLESFRVEAEKRVWIQLSLDRLTGRILSLNQEAVYE